MTTNMRTDVVEWFRPHHRCLLPITGIHISKSLRKTIQSGQFAVTFDQAFERVMRNCLRPRDNWISEAFIRVYTQAHLEGWAHSAEVWESGELVGGVYGVALGQCFSAESMFHRTSNASKVALAAMVEQCRSLGFTIFDAQILNPHLSTLGAFEVGADEYLHMLQTALLGSTTWSASQHEEA